MKITILGAGQVGGTLAEDLANESNDITVVDCDKERLKELQDRLDIRTIEGMGSHPSTLIKAGMEDSDMLIAVTNSDEVNMLACQISSNLFDSKIKKIARVREPDYLKKDQNIFNEENGIPVDLLISPEELVTQNIKHLLDHPGSLQVLDFAKGKVQLVAVRAYYGGPLVGREIAFLRTHMPNLDTRVAAIYRRGSPIMPEGNTVIEADDEVFFIAAKADIQTMMGELKRLDRPYKRIMIAGGGNIGARLAKNLESTYNIKIIEHNHHRCETLADNLNSSIVLQGNASDPELLAEESIEDIDVFCALTNDDEANIMSSLLAKQMGAHKALALINNLAYVDLVQGGKIDIAISPQHSTISALLAHLRQGDMVAVHSLRRGAAEALEVIAHGDPSNSKVVGRKIEDISLPRGASIGAIVRNDEVIIAHDHIVVEDQDHVILFLIDRRYIKDVEQLFVSSNHLAEK